MIILAIETSCDDTCIAILEVQSSKFKVQSNIVSSQVKLHAKYGGVYPTLAKREHQRNLIPVLEQALSKAGLLKSKTFPVLNQRFWCGVKNPRSNPLRMLRDRQSKIQNLKKILKREDFLFKKLSKFLAQYKKPKIDLIAVTVGPGLEPCLWTGVNFAKALAYFWQSPIIPVNHIEAHIVANTINSQRLTINNFPAICLVVSGGHTQLILMRDFRKYKILGETRDDAAGECFDKTARILGLGYPGGPEIEKLSKIYYLKSKIYKIKLPRPMINQKNFDFSFSGLKTAVLYDFKNRLPKVRQSKEYIQAMAAEVQQAIIDVLIEKTLRAVKKCLAKTIILGGGVAANNKLRNQLKEKIRKEMPNIQYLIPNIQFCTDNAAMVGITAYFYSVNKKIKNWENIKVNANQRI